MPGTAGVPELTWVSGLRHTILIKSCCTTLCDGWPCMLYYFTAENGFRHNFGIVFCALSQDEEGKILLKFPEPMKGFRDFLYFDEQLQMSIGNRGSLTIIQQQA